jgi:hypothetical protein
MEQQKHDLIKKNRRIDKHIEKRKASANEVIYIFEKILEDWKTIKIYNTIIQENPNSKIFKKVVEQISTGNCKINEDELTKERYLYYNELRRQVYDKFKKS